MAIVIIILVIVFIAASRGMMDTGDDEHIAEREAYRQAFNK